MIGSNINGTSDYIEITATNYPSFSLTLDHSGAYVACFYND